MRPLPQRPAKATRKSKTRAALVNAAAELFGELGYADTTLDAVAERAGLHVQTLYQHFPSKELLAIAPEQDGLERFKAAVRQKSPDQVFTEFWREWIVASANRTQSRYRASFLRKLSDASFGPAVAGQQQAITKEYLTLLELGVAEELQLDPRTSRVPSLFAAMLWGGNVAVGHRWAASFSRTDLVEEVAAVVGDVRSLMRLWLDANEDGHEHPDR